MRTLKKAIRDNRRHYKYERMLRRIRLNIFEYEDQHTGFDTPMRAMPWTEVVRYTWFKRRWGIRRSPRRGDTCTLDRVSRVEVSWSFDG